RRGCSRCGTTRSAPSSARSTGTGRSPARRQVGPLSLPGSKSTGLDGLEAAHLVALDLEPPGCPHRSRRVRVPDDQRVAVLGLRLDLHTAGRQEDLTIDPILELALCAVVGHRCPRCETGEERLSVACVDRLDEAPHHRIRELVHLDHGYPTNPTPHQLRLRAIRAGICAASAPLRRRSDGSRATSWWCWRD